MYSDSREAQRESFTHYRAQLLFSRLPADKGQADAGAPIHEGAEPTKDAIAALQKRVRGGLLGFTPKATVARAH